MICFNADCSIPRCPSSWAGCPACCPVLAVPTCKGLPLMTAGHACWARQVLVVRLGGAAGTVYTHAVQRACPAAGRIAGRRQAGIASSDGGSGRRDGGGEIPMQVAERHAHVRACSKCKHRRQPHEFGGSPWPCWEKKCCWQLPAASRPSANA